MLNRRTTSVFSQKDISVCLLAAIGHVNTQEDEDHGEGGYSDEALAIAFYCALKHFDSFEEAMIVAVNHGGESDSTGAVTGNILGAAVGYEAIPQFFKDDLEMHDLILHMEVDSRNGSYQKILSHTTAGVMALPCVLVL